MWSPPLDEILYQNYRVYSTPKVRVVDASGGTRSLHPRQEHPTRGPEEIPIKTRTSGNKSSITACRVLGFRRGGHIKDSGVPKKLLATSTTIQGVTSPQYHFLEELFLRVRPVCWWGGGRVLVCRFQTASTDARTPAMGSSVELEGVREINN